MSFDYLLDKINNANIIPYPFPHLDIENLLSEEHLNLIINDPQIHFKKFKTNNQLYNQLINNGWKIQGFPGCIKDWDKYLKYLETPTLYKSSKPVESIGITFRLHHYENVIIKDLLDFMNSPKFHQCLKEKFNIKNKTNIISAIQKNLTGYEISPHPDIRKKALTYLLNINNNSEIENVEGCNTQLLEFKDEYKIIQEFWGKNSDIDRSWVPWNWCQTIKTMNKNNSIVIFSPNSNPATLHAIKLNYDHLKYQRTQIYGNLMYDQNPNLNSTNNRMK